MCGFKASFAVITVKKTDKRSVRHFSASICLTALSASAVKQIDALFLVRKSMGGETPPPSNSAVSELDIGTFQLKTTQVVLQFEIEHCLSCVSHGYKVPLNLLLPFWTNKQMRDCFIYSNSAVYILVCLPALFPYM